MCFVLYTTCAKVSIAGSSMILKSFITIFTSQRPTSVRLCGSMWMLVNKFLLSLQAAQALCHLCVWRCHVIGARILMSLYGYDDFLLSSASSTCSFDHVSNTTQSVRQNAVDLSLSSCLSEQVSEKSVRSSLWVQVSNIISFLRQVGYFGACKSWQTNICRKITKCLHTAE